MAKTLKKGQGGGKTKQKIQCPRIGPIPDGYGNYESSFFWRIQSKDLRIPCWVFYEPLHVSVARGQQCKIVIFDGQFSFIPQECSISIACKLLIHDSIGCWRKLNPAQVFGRLLHSTPPRFSKYSFFSLQNAHPWIWCSTPPLRSPSWSRTNWMTLNSTKCWTWCTWPVRYCRLRIHTIYVYETANFLTNHILNLLRIIFQIRRMLVQPQERKKRAQRGRKKLHRRRRKVD